jgi:hypothetical protein
MAGKVPIILGGLCEPCSSKAEKEQSSTFLISVYFSHFTHVKVGGDERSPPTNSSRPRLLLPFLFPLCSTCLALDY